MEKNVSIPIDDPILAHTEPITSMTQLVPGDLVVAIDRSASYPPGYSVPLYEMTDIGLINREVGQPEEIEPGDGLTIYRLSV